MSADVLSTGLDVPQEHAVVVGRVLDKSCGPGEEACGAPHLHEFLLPKGYVVGNRVYIFICITAM